MGCPCGSSSFDWAGFSLSGENIGKLIIKRAQPQIDGTVSQFSPIFASSLVSSLYLAWKQIFYYLCSQFLFCSDNSKNIILLPVIKNAGHLFICMQDPWTECRCVHCTPNFSFWLFAFGLEFSAWKIVEYWLDVCAFLPWILGCFNFLLGICLYAHWNILILKYCPLKL